MKYEYQCTCGKRAERSFPMGKPKNVTCKCGEQMERVIAPLKFILKGEGWAKNSEDLQKNS